MANYNVLSIQDAYLAILDLNNRLHTLDKNVKHINQNGTTAGNHFIDNFVGGGGAGAGIVPITEVPAGALNGINVLFTLSSNPIVGSLDLSLNGVGQIMGTDYTISGTIIGYTVAPNATDLMIAQYLY